MVKKAEETPAAPAVEAKEVTFALALREDADVKTYQAALLKTNSTFDEMKADGKVYTKKRLGLMWDVGDLWTEFFDKAKSKFGTITNEQIDQVSQDLSEKGSDMASRALRISLQLRERYTKERLGELADNGFTQNHFTVLLQIADKKYRHELETRAIVESLTGDDLRNIVKGILKKPAEAKRLLTPTAKAQYERKANGKKKSDENPIKQVPRMLAKIEEWCDVIGSLVIGLAHVDNVVDEEQRDALTKQLKELSEEGKNLSETVMGMREAVDTAIKTLTAEAPSSPAAIPATPEAPADGRRKVVVKR